MLLQSLITGAHPQGGDNIEIGRVRGGEGLRPETIPPPPLIRLHSLQLLKKISAF